MSVRCSSGASLRRLALGAAMLVASASPGHAITLIYKTSYTGNQVYATEGGPTLVDLGEGNGTSFTVKTPVPARLAIFLNAECAVSAADTNTWLQLDILVDGVEAAPTNGTGNAFCTADGAAGLDHWITAASDASVDVPAGSHTIQLQGAVTLADPGDVWEVGDLSLIVIAKEL
jgi:hypothetical protein